MAIMRNNMASRSKSAVLVAAAIILALTCWSVDAFGISNIIADQRNSNRQYIGASAQSPTRLFAALPSGYQEFGNQAIRKAARQCGIEIDDDGVCQNSDIRLDIEWKAGSIIVTVHGDVSLAAGGASSSDEEDEDEPFEDVEEDVEEDATEEIVEDAQEDSQEEFSLTLLARTINQILDDDGMGLAIAEVHSIEVTTPGVSDELIPGTPQFDAFKGFEVIVKQLDPKKNKVKTIEGRLVERNDEFTIINIKGRMKKMKNSTVQSVRLPKAKREKGSR